MRALWEAVSSLAALLQKSDAIRCLSEGIQGCRRAGEKDPVKRSIGEIFAGYGRLEGQPLLLGRTARMFVPNAGGLANSPEGLAFLKEAAKATVAATWLLEHLRTVFPSLFVLTARPSQAATLASILTGRVPWMDTARHEAVVQPGRVTLVAGVLGVPANELMALLRKVCEEIKGTEEWGRLNQSTASLTGQSRQELEKLIAHYEKLTAEERITDAVGSRLVRRVDHLNAIRSRIAASATEGLRRHFAAFREVEWLVDVVYWLLSTLLVHGPLAEIRISALRWDRLDAKVTVSSLEPFTSSRICNAVVLAPAVRRFSGVLIVTGSSMSFGRRWIRVALSGRVLPDSAGAFPVAAVSSSASETGGHL